MTDHHPITPPPELVEKWRNNARTSDMHFCLEYIATQAARWGADQELEACCEWMRNAPFGFSLSTSSYQLRNSRRPKLPSLKEQALAIVTRGNQVLASEEQKLLRRALEQLND